jgi:hypothetical protein
MSDSEDDSLKAVRCTPLVRCNDAQVAILDVAYADYDALEERQRDRFARIMELWCLKKSLTPEMMNRNEGRSNGGLRIEAFKAFKVRLYGFEITFNGIRTFFIVIIDPAKKQNKADKKILKSAKSRADDLSGEF